MEYYVTQRWQLLGQVTSEELTWVAKIATSVDVEHETIIDPSTFMVTSRARNSSVCFTTDKSKYESFLHIKFGSRILLIEESVSSLY